MDKPPPSAVTINPGIAISRHHRSPDRKSLRVNDLLGNPKLPDLLKLLGLLNSKSSAPLWWSVALRKLPKSTPSRLPTSPPPAAASPPAVPRGCVASIAPRNSLPPLCPSSRNTSGIWELSHPRQVATRPRPRASPPAPPPRRTTTFSRVRLPPQPNLAASRKAPARKSRHGRAFPLRCSFYNRTISPHPRGSCQEGPSLRPWSGAAIAWGSYLRDSWTRCCEVRGPKKARGGCIGGFRARTARSGRRDRSLTHFSRGL